MVDTALIEAGGAERRLAEYLKSHSRMPITSA